MLPILLIPFLVAFCDAQRGINYSSVVGPVLMQWWFYDDTNCNYGSPYETVVLLPGCNPFVNWSPDGTLLNSSLVRSTFLHNCTGEYPFNSCNVEIYNTSDCTDDFVQAAIETGQCTAKASEGTKLFQWQNYSSTPVTSQVFIGLYHNDFCYDAPLDDGDEHDTPPPDEPSQLSNDRVPYGTCQVSGPEASYRLRSCDPADPANPAGPRTVKLDFWWGSTSCQGAALVVNHLSGGCLPDHPDDGRSLLFACSVGPLLGASALMLVGSLLFLL